MNSDSNLMQLELFLSEFIELFGANLVSLDFWIQSGIIIAVFILARWLLTPSFQRALIKINLASKHITSVEHLIRVFSQYAISLMWVMLQWLIVLIYSTLNKPHQLLTLLASLLSAWILIRIASRLIKNEMLSRTIFFVAWSVAILNILDLLAPTLVLLDSISLDLGNIKLTPLLVVKAGFALSILLWLANVSSGFLERRMASSNDVSPAIKVLSVKLLNIGLITAAFLITFSVVGIDLTALAIFGGALGVGLGFGLQKIFSNLVSGIILLMDHSIKPGDVISVGNTFGWINRLGARYVSVITHDGIEHLIPNETLVVERVENWSHSDSFVRLRMSVGISYKSNVEQAMALCVEAASNIPRVVKPEETTCLIGGFGDSSVNLELRVWIADPINGRANVMSQIYLKIWKLFKQNGIEIPFPQRDLHLASVNHKLIKHFENKGNDCGKP